MKNKTIGVKVSLEEYDFLKNKADENNMSVAEYIRQKMIYEHEIHNQNSFEYKVLKSLSIVQASSSVMAKSHLNDEQHNLVKNHARSLMKKNGIKLEDDK